MDICVSWPLFHLPALTLIQDNLSFFLWPCCFPFAAPSLVSHVVLVPQHQHTDSGWSFLSFWLANVGSCRCCPRQMRHGAPVSDGNSQAFILCWWKCHSAFCKAGAKCTGQLWTEPVFSMSVPLCGWWWPWNASAVDRLLLIIIIISSLPVSDYFLCRETSDIHSLFSKHLLCSCY